MRMPRHRWWRVYNIATYNMQRAITYTRTRNANEGRAWARAGFGGTPVEHSFTSARACELTAAATCVTYVVRARSTGALINSVALRAENGGPRSKIAREKKKRKMKTKDRIEDRIPADKRASGARMFILSCFHARWNITYNGTLRRKKSRVQVVFFFFSKRR